jgi:hypothetical protein
MRQTMTSLLCAATAAVLWCAPAQAQDLKSTNGAACVPIIESTGVPAAANVVSDAGGRFSTQSVPGGDGAEPPYVLTCRVPNVVGAGQRSGIISYKWAEKSL